MNPIGQRRGIVAGGAAVSFIPSFYRSCKQFPAEPALVFADRVVTYGELFGLVQGIRRYIEATVPAAERRIAVFATQEVGTYAAILAVLASDRAYVPLNPRNPPERNNSCLRQADVGTLLYSSEPPELPRLIVNPTRLIRAVNTSGIAPSGLDIDAPAIDPSAMAYLLFTSGSTGAPKGVPVYHRNLDRFLTALLHEMDFEFRSTDRFLQMFDLTFDLSIMSFAVPLSIGASCHVVPEGAPGFLGVAKTLTRGMVSVALMVPSVLVFLEGYLDELRFPDMRYSLFCGEALSHRLASAWRACVPSARVINAYGPTEATIFCSTFELGRSPERAQEYQGAVSIGVPMPGTEFAVIDENLAPVSPGAKGELVILGGQVTDQYWHNAEKTAAAFVTMHGGGRGYRTGDMAFMQGDDFFYCGRVDNQFKVDGYRVEAGEIEYHARSFEGVRQAAVVGLVGAAGKTTLHLFVESSVAFTDEQLAACRTHLAQRVPSYMVPRNVHGLTSLPLSQNGKVDRKALSALIRDRP